MSKFSLLFHCSMKFKKTNRISPDGTPRSAATCLGLFCLPMSHKKDARLIWVKWTVFTDTSKNILKILDRLNHFH